MTRQYVESLIYRELMQAAYLAISRPITSKNIKSSKVL